MTYRGSKERFRGKKISDRRIAWTRNHLLEMIVRQFLPEDNGDLTDDDGVLLSETQIGPNVRLEVKSLQAYRGVGFDLTAMTMEELEGFRSTINLAIDLAVPVVRERDRSAREEDSSRSTNPRVYRGLPEVVVRQGAFSKYGEGVHDRPSDVPPGDGGADSLDGGDRGSGGVLADDAQGEPGNLVDPS